MNINYTLFNKISTKNYSSYNHLDDAIDFLKNPKSFRNFDEGLCQIIFQKDFIGDKNNPYEIANYLISKLRAINSTIEDSTVLSWFISTPSKTYKSRPKIEPGSRLKIYEICFALNLSFDETVWFFEHVYYDRPFNCHTIEEAVFYYAFKHNINYSKAKAIINEIYSTHSSFVSNNVETNYTQFIQDNLDNFNSIDELKLFLSANKDDFNHWNQSALTTLNFLVSQLIGLPSSKNDIDTLKRTLKRSSSTIFKINVDDYKHCGLLIQEIIFDAQSQTNEPVSLYILDTINNKNTRKNTFILERLLCTSSGLKKNIQIPYIVRNNFPSKKTFSDILSKEKISISKSYDSIRKAIILLDFYYFWINVKLDTQSQLKHDELIHIYRDEADNSLYNCGYNKLYEGNPYDWIFLCSIQNKEPLAYFRSCITELLPEDF